MEHKLLLKECLDALKRMSEITVGNNSPMGEGHYFVYICPCCLVSNSFMGGSAVKHRDKCQLKRSITALELLLGEE